jgi:hypothetical protein
VFKELYLPNINIGVNIIQLKSNKMEKKKIGILTYIGIAHRKTYDLVCQLIVKGYQPILIPVPMTPYKQRHPLVQHRPTGGFFISDLTKGFNLDVITWEDRNKCDEIIVGGCSLIPELDALNAHPGYLPLVRGLDSLKWAIYDEMPIGVTIHRTTDSADDGPIYARTLVPVYFEDTFHSLAYRVYQTEINMLVDSLFTEDVITPHERKRELTKRMPPFKEAIMLEKFQLRRKNAASIYS